MFKLGWVLTGVTGATHSCLTGPDTLHGSYTTQTGHSMCRMKPNRTAQCRPGSRLNMLRPMLPHPLQNGSPCRQLVGPAVCCWSILMYSVCLMCTHVTLYGFYYRHDHAYALFKKFIISTVELAMTGLNMSHFAALKLMVVHAL